jgi:hypothetical protein
VDASAVAGGHQMLLWESENHHNDHYGADESPPPFFMRITAQIRVLKFSASADSFYF